MLDDQHERHVEGLHEESLDITLEKLDAVRDRLNVSYAEARRALEETKGNVVEAIMRIEESLAKEAQQLDEGGDLAQEGRPVRIGIQKGPIKVNRAKQEWQEARAKMEERGEKVAKTIMQTVKQGSSLRFIVKKKDRVLLDVPAAVAAVGALVGPYAAALGVGAALLTRCSVEVARADKREAPGPKDESPDREV